VSVKDVAAKNHSIARVKVPTAVAESDALTSTNFIGSHYRGSSSPTHSKAHLTGTLAASEGATAAPAAVASTSNPTAGCSSTSPHGASLGHGKMRTLAERGRSWADSQYLATRLKTGTIRRKVGHTRSMSLHISSCAAAASVETCNYE
jgi:hypothetical protein